MSNETEKFTTQLEAARDIMDRYRTALSALGDGTESREDAEFQRRMEIARERMKKYHAAYRALAK